MASIAVTASKSRLIELTKVWPSLRCSAVCHSPCITIVGLQQYYFNSSILFLHIDKIYQLQCSIFGTTFNPTQQRLGNNVLRQRLKGPQLAAYYPRKSATIEDITKEFEKHDLETWNDKEEDRLELLAITKLRGKGAPKKKREKDRKNIDS